HSPPGAAKRIELQRLVTSRHHFSRLLSKTLGSARPLIPPVRVGLELLVTASAHEIVDRLFQVLPYNIPTRHLDGSHGGHVQLTPFSVDIPGHPLNDQLCLERIHSHVQSLQFVNGSFNCPGKAIERRFTDAVNALIGFEFYENPVLPGISHDVSLCVSDFH